MMKIKISDASLTNILVEVGMAVAYRQIIKVFVANTARIACSGRPDVCDSRKV